MFGWSNQHLVSRVAFTVIWPIYAHNVADVTATSTLCKTSRGGPDALAGWIWTPSRLFVSPVPTETPPEICFYSKRKNDLFRPSETHPAGVVQFPVTDL